MNALILIGLGFIGLGIGQEVMKRKAAAPAKETPAPKVTDMPKPKVGGDGTE